MHDAHCQESMCLLEDEEAEHAKKGHKGAFLSGHQRTWAGGHGIGNLFHDSDVPPTVRDRHYYEQYFVWLKLTCFKIQGSQSWQGDFNQGLLAAVPGTEILDYNSLPMARKIEEKLQHLEVYLSTSGLSELFVFYTRLKKKDKKKRRSTQTPF